MTGSSIPPKPTGTARALDRGPSLRWRLRRWILQKLDAWPRARPEPTTEWGRMRRAERRRLVAEVESLRGAAEALFESARSIPLDLEDEEEEYIAVPASKAWALVEAISASSRREIQEKLDELAAEYVREGS